MPKRKAAKPSTHSSKSTARGGVACGCGVPGGFAVGVDKDLKQRNVMHLRRIEGQLRGIATMVGDDRYCADIITQIAAVRESLHSVARNLMRNHLKHCAAQAMQRKGKGRDAMVEELLALVGKVAR